ncbi:hypothetical protein [Enterobacter hormaechei]|uniref:hypothetical protein n=1 Tax=Enterobacter hormaechei TaxID=158836 RepID=UPI00254D6AD6|nr:hypothetical protein [Enterobacter hormaechei]MDL0027651.1 hypothetical protein [Enterobacter hormaechei]MDL0045817.1 hypothetical protein [Enterobacter hormaechei]HED2752158.1 hypothetical protein [Enterobacter hormaechei subsp. steigerwaltii]
MASNQSLIFEIRGDESGLQRSLKNAGNGLSEFGDKAGGIFGDLGSNITTITGQLSGFSTGLVGVAGSVGLVAAGFSGLLLSSNEYVKSLNEVSRASGLSVTELQQLQSTFQGLGLDIEKFGDINRDVLDHLGDAFANGGSIADDLKSVGVNVQDMNKYLNQSDGGIKAIAHSFYEMQKAGKTTAETTFLLESMGSDASKLVDVMKQYKNETELMNAIYSQHAILTDDNAKKYQEFDKKVASLTTSFSLFKANALAPTIDELNNILNLLNGNGWTTNKFTDWAKQFWYGGDSAIAKAFRKLDGVGEVGYSIDVTAKLTSQAQDLLDFVNNNTGTKKTVEAPKGGWVDKDQEAAKAKAAADKAEAERKKAEAKRIQAGKVLQQTLTGIAGSGAMAQVQQFNQAQNDIEKRIRGSAKTLGKTEAETTEMLKQQYENRKRLFKEMTDSMLQESDPKKLAQNIAAIGGQNINGTQLTDIQNAQNTRLGIDNTDPFQMKANQSTLDKVQSDGQAELALNQQLYEQKLVSFQDYQSRMAAINTATNNKMQQANIDAQQKTLSMYATGAQNLGTMLSGAFGESNAAAQAAFAISKGIAIAQSIINIQQGISQAMALGWPMGIAAGLKVAAEGASIISTIKGTSIQGQAHDGWDSLPSTGTYNLEKGERVVGKSLNQDLTKYLSNQDSSKSGDIKIDAPLIINSNGQISDSDFQKMCDKHADTLTQAIRKSQKNNV